MTKRTIIETEWDKRRKVKERKESKAKSPHKTKQEVKQAKKKLKARNQFIDKAANSLRNKTPKSELWFLEFLKQSNLDTLFLQNIRFNDYIPDFISLDHRIIIEVDGSAHWNNNKQLAKDKLKDEYYQRLNYTIYRVNHFDHEKAKQVILLIKQQIS